MGDFKRGLSEPKLAALHKLADDPHPNWWKDLLSLWVPSGQSTGKDGLRLALRNGYLNFYRHGQSVALVCFGRANKGVVEARMEIHAKYVWPHSKIDAKVRLLGHTITCKGMPSSIDYKGINTLKDWIKESEKKAGPEKCGVDMVVGNNSAVIDLEMAMPAWRGKKSALRVDMAALEVIGGKPRVVLWEAKPLNAPSLRAQSGDADVVTQMNEYKEYLKEPGHRELVSEAYIITCTQLQRLVKMAGRHIQLDESVELAANLKFLEVDPEPRLAVFQGMDGRGYGEPKPVEFSSGWEAHLGKLRNNKVKVAVGEDPRKLRLKDAE